MNIRLAVSRILPASISANSSSDNDKTFAKDRIEERLARRSSNVLTPTKRSIAVAFLRHNMSPHSLLALQLLQMR